MDPNYGWLALWVAWGLFETWSLVMRADKLQPNTYWLRRLPWFVRAGAILWLTQHFLLCGSPC